MKKTRKQIRKRMTAIEKSLEGMKPGSTKASKAKMAGAAAACVAGVAGAAAVVHYVRARGRGSQLHVHHDGARWALSTDGSSDSAETFGTKRKAVTAARRQAAAAAPSELNIHRVDGSVEQSHSYELD